MVMKSLTEQPAVLSVHQGSAGQYILRVTDLRYRPLVIGVTKLLPDASSFVVITPSDIKVFAVGNGAGPTVTEVPDGDDTQQEVELDEETRAAIDAEEQRSVPGAVETRDAEVGTAGAEPEPVAKATRRRKPSTAPVAGHDEACGRCGGAGKTRVILDGGGGAETACPICKGTGTMRRYGAKR